MAKIVWDELSKRFFDRGVDHGVLYSSVDGLYPLGVPWNGLVSVASSPTGAEPNKMYADNIPYVTINSAEEWAGTIECFAFPPEFLIHDGVRKTASGMQVSQQSRETFGFSWRTLKGNAIDEDLGYVINLAYGVTASPSERTDATVNDSPELRTMSFSLSSTPVPVTGFKPTAIIRIDSTDEDVDPEGLEALLDVLYGEGATAARLPLPDEVDELLTVTP